MIANGGLSGGSFWQGVRQGLITSGLNHVAHDFVKGVVDNGDPVRRPSATSLDKACGIGNKDWQKIGGRWTITTKKEILQWDSKKGEI